MINLIDNGKTHFFFDDYNMMLERVEWANNHIGDALWRTSLALISSGNDDLKTSIYLCTTHFYNGKIRFLRHPENYNDDTSRDQAIMAMIALKLHDNKEYQYINQFLDYRISKKFTWSDAWFWVKGRYLMWRIFNFYKFLFVFFEPSYSKHLFCWMIWSSEQKMPLLRALMLQVIPKDNYLCRALLGVKEDVPKLKPMTDFRWQRDVNNFDGVELTKDESEYNCLDIEVLNYIKNN